LDSSRSSRLTPLQSAVLEAFFRNEQRFFLTGGGALAGFHLGHRETNDLDLFTTADNLEEGDSALREAAASLGASIENVRTSPEFRRRIVGRGREAVVVDLVRERSHQAYPEKPIVQGIRVDPPEEIFANKLCTLLSRAELRDLVDTRALEGAGFDLETALSIATRKDGGLTPGQLAWVLSEITIGDDARLPGGVSVAELRAYVADLIERLSRRAFPRS
jgi:predicted nucleotidyltransferase component of viral defense system